MRNTWVICREAGDNSAKAGLIPDVDILRHLEISEVGDPALSGFGEGKRNRIRVPKVLGLTLYDKPAAYQLVGKVTAYQG